MKTSQSVCVTIMLFMNFLLLPFSLHAQEQDTRTFGIVPQQSAATLARVWGPVLKYLGEKTGYRLVFRTAKDIPTFEARVAAGEYDMAYMNPYHYEVFHQAAGYEAFAKERDKKIQGIVVVLKDSPYQQVTELAGTSMAFPSPAAFAASILPQAQFRQQGIAITPQYVSSHDSVYLSVSKGIYPAGGGILRTFGNMPEDIQAQLRILWKTDEFTPHAFAAHPRVSPDIVRVVQQAMIEMETDSEGKRLLEELNFKGIEAAQDADWDDIRGLKLDLLDQYLQ